MMDFINRCALGNGRFCAEGRDGSWISDFLQTFVKNKRIYENARMFYVKELHLFCSDLTKKQQVLTILYFICHFCMGKKEKRRRPPKRKRAGTLNISIFLFGLIHLFASEKGMARSFWQCTLNAPQHLVNPIRECYINPPLHSRTAAMLLGE